MTFAIEWGIFGYEVMQFDLINAPTTFQQLMSHMFKEYLKNMEERKIVKSTEFLGKKCWTYAGNKSSKYEGSW